MKKRIGIAGLIACLGAIYVAILVLRTPPALENKRIVAAAELFDQHGELNSSMPILLDFSATWCKPCQMMAPAVEAEKEVWAGKVKFIKVDVDIDKWELAKHFNIEAIPALVLLSPKSKQATIHIGTMDQAKIHSLIETAFH